MGRAASDWFVLDILAAPGRAARVAKARHPVSPAGAFRPGPARHRGGLAGPGCAQANAVTCARGGNLRRRREFLFSVTASQMGVPGVLAAPGFILLAGLYLVAPAIDGANLEREMVELMEALRRELPEIMGGVCQLTMLTQHQRILRRWPQ